MTEVIVKTAMRTVIPMSVCVRVRVDVKMGDGGSRDHIVDVTDGLLAIRYERADTCEKPDDCGGHNCN